MQSDNMLSYKTNRSTAMLYVMVICAAIFIPATATGDYQRVICGLNAGSPYTAKEYSKLSTNFASLSQSNQLVSIINSSGLWPLITADVLKRGISQPSLVFTTRGKNAIVSRWISGKTFTMPIIVVDSVWMYSIAATEGSSWVITAIYAHELGHILYEHIYGGGASSEWQREYDADWFAGYALCKLGATLEEAQAVFYYITDYQTEEYDNSHPSLSYRLEAVKSGFSKAGCKSKRNAPVYNFQLHLFSKYPYGVEIEVDGVRYKLEQWESARIPLSDHYGVLRIWHCPAGDCTWTSYNVYAGHNYRIKDGYLSNELILVE